MVAHLINARNHFVDDAAKTDCSVVYKVVFLKTYLLPWRIYIGLQENLHPKKTFYVFQPHHYWQLGPYINVVVPTPSNTIMPR